MTFSGTYSDEKERMINITYRQFKKWCNNRCFDGCWGYKEALICLNVYSEINKLPFWKRKKAWKQEEEFIVNKIVTPIDSMIEAYKEADKIIKGGKK